MTTTKPSLSLAAAAVMGAPGETNPARLLAMAEACDYYAAAAKGKHKVSLTATAERMRKRANS